MAKADRSQDEKNPHDGISANPEHERAPVTEAEALMSEEDEHAHDVEVENVKTSDRSVPNAVKTSETDVSEKSDAGMQDVPDRSRADEAIPEGDGFHDQPAVLPEAHSAFVKDDKLVDPADPETSALSAKDMADTSQADAVGSGPSPTNETQTSVTKTVIQRRGGFLPIFFGGVLAAGVGFVAGQYPDGWPFAMQTPDTFRGDITSQLAAQAEQLTAAQAALDLALDQAANEREALRGTAAASTDRLGSLFSQITQLESKNTGAFDSLSAKIAENTDVALDISDQTAALMAVTETSNLRMTALSDQLAELQTRLAALEKRPVVEAVSPEAIAAYEREIDRLREDVTAQRAEIASIAQEAVTAEQSASSLASEAAAQAAVAEILAALQNGRPYEAQLQRLADAELVLPAALTASASTGVSTQASLIELFPDAARAALAAARAAENADAQDRSLGAILRRQFAVRSLTPQEGMTTDAILSRAEDALRRGDLATVLAELNSLSPAASAALAEMRDLIAARHDAFAATMAIGHNFK